MKWSLQIAKVAGIKIYIHWSFILLIGWVLLVNMGPGYTAAKAFYLLFFIACVFVCITLHELGHALVAKRFNYLTKDIILLPIGGMARMNEFPEKPVQELLVAIAGPCVNFVIAIILFPFISLPVTGAIGGTFNESPADFASPRFFLFNIFAVNLVIGLFNLIPAFPMDGGRILRSLLAMRMTRVKATSAAAHTGEFIAILFFFLGLLYNPFLSIIAVFIFLMAMAENTMVRSNFALRGHTVSDVLIRDYFEVDAEKPLAAAVQMLLGSPVSDFLVRRDGQVVGVLDRKGIIRTLSTKGYNATVADALQENVEYLSPDMPLDKALNMMQMERHNIMPVKENGNVIGIIDVHHILEFISLHEAVQSLSAEQAGRFGQPPQPTS